MDLLEVILSSRGRWTSTIARECYRQGAKLELPNMYSEAMNIFGDPIQVKDDEHAQIRATRRQLAVADGKGEHSDKHLGEAETLTIIAMRRLNAKFITDDGAARVLNPKVCLTTWDLLRFSMNADYATRSEVESFYETLKSHNRTSLAEIRTPQKFQAWLDESLL